MSGPFTELLTPIEDFRFLPMKIETDIWYNKTNDFFVKEYGGKWLWKPTYQTTESNDHIGEDKMTNLLSSHHGKLYPTRTKAQEAALLWFKEEVPEYALTMSIQLGKGNNSRLMIKNKNKVNSHIDLFYVLGRSGNWKIQLPTYNSFQDLKEAINEPSLTKKLALTKLHNILSCNLPFFYNEQQYQQSLNKDVLSYKYWWTLFIKPEVNLTKLF